jgi:hypothetical protein
MPFKQFQKFVENNLAVRLIHPAQNVVHLKKIAETSALVAHKILLFRI